jgi:hypothetical protein
MRYQILIEKLIYLTITRPDITYVVSMLSHFMQNPLEEHRVRYLKKEPGKGILYAANRNLSIEVFTDADWVGCTANKRSTDGYCTLFGGNLVTGQSKKFSVIVRSSVEVEYRTMADGVCERVWIKYLLEEIGFSISKSVVLLCDN